MLLFESYILLVLNILDGFHLTRYILFENLHIERDCIVGHRILVPKYQLIGEYIRVFLIPYSCYTSCDYAMSLKRHRPYELLTVMIPPPSSFRIYWGKGCCYWIKTQRIWQVKKSISLHGNKFKFMKINSMLLGVEVNFEGTYFFSLKSKKESQMPCELSLYWTTPPPLLPLVLNLAV
jgi:hypothetical protein